MTQEGIRKGLKVLIIAILLPVGIIVPFLSLESHHTNIPIVQAQSSLEQRTENYKKNIRDRVPESELSRITLRCSVAQTNAKNISSRIATVQSTRVEAYDEILKKLNDMLTKLEVQAFETTKLKDNIGVLTQKITEFKANMAGYKQAVDDLNAIDCTKDPLSFKAALITARNHHAKLSILVGDIRTYIANTIKPTLKQVRGQIEKGQTVGGETE